MKKSLSPAIFRIITLIVVISGALASLGFTIYTGRNNKSVLLIFVFAVWVLSPFVALIVGNVISNRWPVLNRKIFYGLMIVITLGTLAFYSGIFSFPGTKTAFNYLVIPFISWLLIAIFIPVSRSLS